MNVYRKNQTGQTIVEVLIALATGVIIVTAMTVVILNSLTNAQYSTNENLANKYTQEGMEYITLLQKNDLTTFQKLEGDSGVKTYCFAAQDDKAGTSGCKEICTTEPCKDKACRIYTNVADCSTFSASNTTFRRTISIEKSATTCTIHLKNGDSLTDLTKVAVGTNWGDSKCSGDTPYCHSATVVSCF